MPRNIIKELSAYLRIYGNHLLEKEDVITDAIIELLAWKRTLSFHLIHENLPALYVIAKRLIIKEKKRLEKQDNISCEEDFDKIDDRNANLSYIDYKIDMEIIRNSLNDMEKIIIDMMYEGYTYKEIAKKCGCTENLIQQRVFRMKQKIKERFPPPPRNTIIRNVIVVNIDVFVINYLHKSLLYYSEKCFSQKLNFY